MASEVLLVDLDSASKTASAATRSRPLSESSQRGRIYRERLASFYRHWWFELLCILLMCLSFLAIILTLAMHQGQPLPRWPFSISINALLSIYGTVLKGSMLLVVAEGLSQVKWLWFYNDYNPLRDVELFDSATRGPKGALDLLWASRRRFRRSFFSIIGATLTIIAITIDPFTQQIVRYYPCTKISHQAGPAIIPLIHNHSFPATLAPLNSLGLGIQAALFSGLFGNTPGSTVADPPFHCPTSNCDFHDPYYTLAVCGRCDDLTGKLVHKWSNMGPLGRNWSYTLPHSSLVLARPGMDTDAGATIVAQTGPFNKFHVSWTAIEMKLIRYTSPSIEQIPWSKYNKTVGAAHCRIFPCVNKYNASVRAGKLNEKLLASVPLSLSWFFINSTNTFMPTARISCLSEQEKHALSKLGYDLRSSNGWLFLGSRYENLADDVPGSYIVQGSPQLPNINKQCLFQFNWNLWFSLWNFVSATEFFGGKITPSSEGGQIEGPPQLMALYNDGNITFATLQNKFESLASSLSSYIRQTNLPENGTQPAIGVVNDRTTCVSVRWPWLILPLSLLVFTVVFFFSTLYRSRRRYRWKSSSLALLFHGLDHKTRSKYGNAATSEEIAAAAEKMLVRLRETDEGIRFSEAALLGSPSNTEYKGRP